MAFFFFFFSLLVKIFQNTAYIKSVKKEKKMFIEKWLSMIIQTFSGRIGFHFFHTVVPEVKVRTPEYAQQMMTSRSSEQFLAVKPKIKEFDTILTFKLNDSVLKLASFVTKN